MPFERPSLNTLIERTQADIASRLPGSQPLLRRSVVGVLARAVAGAVHGLYGYLEWLAKQLMPDTAESWWLERWAAIWGVRRRPGAYAAGPVTLTGTNGAVVPAGTALQRSDGVLYTLAADATITDGTATAPVNAQTAGVIGNAAAGSMLTLVSPIAGVSSAVTIAASGITNGVDAESDDSLRARLLARIQLPPHGGAAFDYVAWALEVPGITRAWPFPRYLGAGTVGVAIVNDAADPITPDPAKVQEVQKYIEERCPVTADVTVFAPTPVAVNFKLSVTPDTAAVRAAVEAELRDLLIREAVPGGTIRLSRIREAISIAAGEEDHVLFEPTSNLSFQVGEIPVMGGITWQ